MSAPDLSEAFGASYGPDVFFRKPTDTVDVYTRFHDKRIIVLKGQINDDMATNIIMQMMDLALQSPDDPITLMINSGGGSCSAGMAIFAAMKTVAPEVHTVGFGRCSSMAAILLAAGTKGHRSLYPGSYMMIHQPFSPATAGKTTDAHLTAEGLKSIRAASQRLLMQFAGLPQTTEVESLMMKAMEPDTVLNAKMAKRIGFVDSIIQPDFMAAAKGKGELTPEQADRLDALSILETLDDEEFAAIDPDDWKTYSEGMRSIKKLIAIKEAAPPPTLQ